MSTPDADRQSPERPDVIVIMTDQERAAPPYESADLKAWRRNTLTGQTWFDDHALNFGRHYTGSLACVPSRPTLFTGQFPDVHGVTQTDGLGKLPDDSRLRWLRAGEVPTLGHWFRAAGYDTHYDGKWHITHADLIDDEGNVVPTSDDKGVVDQAGVDAYIAADPLDPFGFSGWVGPEPHGPKTANCGLRRDPIIAARVVAWLEDRYLRRRDGDEDAMRPFLLVASFVNPHDITLFPAWVNFGNPLSESPLDPPHIDASPTADEDLSTKPAAQIAYRAAYPTGYAPAALINRAYSKHAQEYRDMYYRLHAEVDGPIDRVRQTVTEGGSEHAVILRTSDHGELLGSHGGLHQKWFMLYDEATRVPFSIARIGANATAGAQIVDAPTSHVDIVPTLLAAAGIDEETTGALLRESFTEVHPLPGTNLMPTVDGAQPPDTARAVYLMTRDNVLEGDNSRGGLARKYGLKRLPAAARIRVPAHVGSNFEGVVMRVAEDDVTGGADHLWKVVRTFDDPATWTEPGVRHLAANPSGHDAYRTTPVPDQWELYDLDADPIEAVNRWHDPLAADVFAHLQHEMKQLRADSVPERTNPWPYESRHSNNGPKSDKQRLPTRLMGGLRDKLHLR
jgi:arylsulfatase A-like enzyme